MLNKHFMKIVMRYFTIFFIIIFNLFFLRCDNKTIIEVETEIETEAETEIETEIETETETEDENETIIETEKIPIPTVSPDDPAIIPVNKTSEWFLDKHNDKINNIKYNQKIIFIGDSITQCFEDDEAWIELNQKYNNKITNLGFSSDCTQHVLWRIENGEFPVGINPEFAVIMIGVNNIAQNYQAESIAAGIGKIVTIINQNSPVTKIILLSILPSEVDYNYTTNSNEVNEIIKKYDRYININYVDIGQYYVDNDGSLIDELFTDRLHLTTAGYNVWKEKIFEIIPYEDTQQ